MMTCRLAQPDELPELVLLARGGMSEQRARLVVTILEDLIRSGRTERLILVACAEDEDDVRRKSISAAIFVDSGDGSANLLAIGAGQRAETDADLAIDRCLRFGHDLLAGRGVRFVQAMRDPDDHPRALQRNGYQPLATLDYLHATTADAGPMPNAADRSSTTSALKFVPYCQPEGLSEASFLELIGDTYQGSLDCPKIAEFRSTAEAVESYRRVLTHAPELWFVVWAADPLECLLPLGCLLLTPYPVAGTLELTYMALLANHRGKSLGGELIAFAKGVARRCGLGELTLAVDHANIPARRLYERHGFKFLLSETAWGLSM